VKPLPDQFVYDAPIGKAVRLTFNYGGHSRPFLWFVVDKDRSLYFGIRGRSTKPPLHGSTTIKANTTQTTVKLASGTEAPTNAKLSFHGSGIGNYAGKRYRTPSLRDIKKYHQLVAFALAHPKTFKPHAMRKFDIGINYPIDQGRGVGGSLVVSPADITGLVEGPPNCSYQMNFIFRVPGVPPIADIPEYRPLDVQIVLGHGVEPWPPYTVTIWRTDNILP
jgi:hypothetical protein